MSKQAYFLFSFLLSASALAHCPLSSDAKKLIEESVTRNTLDTKWVLNQSHPGPSRGFARNLIGWSNAHLGALTLAEQCTGPVTFDKFCESACETSIEHCELERCSQLGCEQKGVDTIKLWWQPAPVKYTTDSAAIPKYSVSYNTRPTTKFRFDSRVEGKLLVSWTANDTVIAKRLSSTARLNVSSSLVASGVSTSESPQGAGLAITYPYLSTSGRTRINLSFNAHGEVSGKVSVNGTRLANIAPGSSEEEAAVINWLGSCR